MISRGFFAKLKLMKKAVFGFILLVLVVVYLFSTDFGFIKKLFDYNAPTITSPKISSPKLDSEDKVLGFLNVPDGFKVSIAVKGLNNPRVMLFDSKGRMLVSETKAGRVIILDPVKSQSDHGTSENFENKRILIEGLKSPHGMDFYPSTSSGQVTVGDTNYLYIAETHQVARYPYDVDTGKLIATIGQNIAALPADGRHFTRTILFGPNWRDRELLRDSFPLKEFYSKIKLYISVGSSCDVCEETTWKRAAILESDPEGTFTGEFAGGLRNAVFFAFHPETGEIWATEMGRDNLGDNLPPDEINIVKVAEPEDKIGARRFGWPFCYGNKVKDKTFDPKKLERTDISTNCRDTIAPIIEIPAHSAPLGLAFAPKSWGRFSGDLLVAYHGSWNRSEPTGYKVVRFKVDKNGKVSETADFITGWLNENKKEIYGRPVDLKFYDGALYISDDTAGIIYKLEPK